MKRILTAVCLCAVMTAAAGCAMTQTAGNVDNRMNGAFSAEVTLHTEENDTRAVLTRYGTDAWSVSFTEPAALSGVQLDFIDNEVNASYKGLEFSVPQSAQAVKTMLSELMDIVDEMAAETELNGTQGDDGIVCEGEIDEGSYTLCFNKEGIPVEFSLPCYGLTLTFDSFTENGSAQTSDAAAETASAPTETTTASETTASAEQ